MITNLKAPSIDSTPEALLQEHITTAATRIAPIPIDSDEGRRLYRTLAQHVWTAAQRPVCAGDIRDLWEKIDAVKRGSPVKYDVCGIHFWAADYTNALAAETMAFDEAACQRLAAWAEEWPNVCILGQTGRGKSTTLNRLFGVKMAEISHHTACTRTVTDYRLVTGSFMNRTTGIVLWDVPGYGDDRESFETYQKLYRRMARKCDVVIFMLDNDRSSRLDLKMFKRLKKRVPLLETKLVVAVNKADLFHPCDWDHQAQAPSPGMNQTIIARAAVLAEALELKQRERVVPISALKNWNIFALLNAMIEAAGVSKGASLLHATHPDDRGTMGTGAKAAGDEIGQRFGINAALRTRFRAVLGKA